MKEAPPGVCASTVHSKAQAHARQRQMGKWEGSLDGALSGLQRSPHADVPNYEGLMVDIELRGAGGG